jgi:hypothetical protein
MEYQGWEAWAKKFKPQLNHLSSDPEEYLFLPEGEELTFVQSQDPNQVWTNIMLDKSDLIVAGDFTRDRLGYFITEIPWANQEDYVLLSQDVECECYLEEGYEDGEEGDVDCSICEGAGWVTRFPGDKG